MEPNARERFVAALGNDTRWYHDCQEMRKHCRRAKSSRDKNGGRYRLSLRFFGVSMACVSSAVPCP